MNVTGLERNIPPCPPSKGGRPDFPLRRGIKGDVILRNAYMRSLQMLLMLRLLGQIPLIGLGNAIA